MPSLSDAWAIWEERFAEFLDRQLAGADPAHDPAHVERVVGTARRLADLEDATMDVVVPAAWLHDCVVVPKDSPERAEASTMAAEAASGFLEEEGYPEEWIPKIEHAIEAHSYSAEVAPETLEAKIVQDADRIDALGAVGIGRCFMVGGACGQTVYDSEDPFCDNRTPDDTTYIIDHFYEKLLDLPDTMQTVPGREEAERRASFMKTYLQQLAAEIGEPRPDGPGRP